MEEIDLLYYWRALMRRKRIAIITAVVVFALAAVVVLQIPKVYSGETTLIFPDQGGGLSAQLSALTGLSLPISSGEAFSGRDTYGAVLQSRTMSESVCDRLHLDRYGVDFEDLQKRLQLDKPRDGGLVLTVFVPTSWLKGHVSGRDLKAETARFSAKVANTYIDELKRFDKTNTLFLSKKNRMFVEDQLSQSKKQLSAAEERLARFQETNPTLLTPDNAGALSDKTIEMAAKRIEADIALEQAAGETAKVENAWKGAAPDGYSPEVFISSPIITDLQQRLSDLEVRLAALQRDYTDDYPDVIVTKEDIANIKSRLNAEISKVISGKASSLSPGYQELLRQVLTLEIERAGLVARRNAIDKAMSKVEGWAEQLPPKEMAYVRAIRDVKASEAVYMTLLTEYAKARIEEDKDADKFMVLDIAKPKKKPASPRVKLILAVSLLFGLALGSVVAVTGELRGASREAAERKPSEKTGVRT